MFSFSPTFVFFNTFRKLENQYSKHPYVCFLSRFTIFKKLVICTLCVYILVLVPEPFQSKLQAIALNKLLIIFKFPWLSETMPCSYLCVRGGVSLCFCFFLCRAHSSFMHYIWLCLFSLLIQESHLEKRPLFESCWALFHWFCCLEPLQ